MSSEKKIPVILQTDIGGDIDDFWALSMILKQPQLDLKFILTDTDNTVYRAAICARLLEEAGRTDVEIGAGLSEWPIFHRETHLEWVKQYQLKSYPRYTPDGIRRLIEIVRASDEPMTLVAIGPAPSLAEALRQAPDIAEKLNFVGMFGSIYKEHRGKPGKIAEYNVKRNIPAAQAVFSADWLSAAITPLDTCGQVVLESPLYKQIEECPARLVKNIATVYHIWRASYNHENWYEIPEASSILYDTVAVHMASSDDFIKMIPMKLTVDDEGFLQETPDGKPFKVAIDWTDLPGYCRFLVDTLIH